MNRHMNTITIQHYTQQMKATNCQHMWLHGRISATVLNKISQMWMTA